MMKAKSTVLIVDEQPAMRDALEGLLSNQGYELAFANNGQDAYCKAALLIPDVILLDVMPGMDGFEVCQRLRADTTLAQVPIILVTALDDRDSLLRGIEAGADDFISKPYDKVELRARVQTITRLNRYRRLLTEKAKFEWIIENTEEAYLVLNHDNHIPYANAKARFYLNQPTNQNDSINETFLELTSQHYHQVHEPPKKSLSLGKETMLPRYIVRSNSKTAHACWLRVDVMEMPGNSEEKYLVHLCDVTNTVLANRQSWVLSEQINHKLKAPLIFLLGSLEFLLKNLSILTIDKIKEFLEMAYSGSTRLRTQLEDILKNTSVSNTTQARQESCTVTNLLLTLAIVKEMLDIEFIPVFEPHNIANPDQVCVPISGGRIEIVLTELFSNAKKFHPNDTPRLKVNIASVSEGILIQICDCGLTLSPEQLANMWTHNYQDEKHLTGETRGIGSGLSMVASLIWEVGGTCHAYNRTNDMVIELTLPLLKTSAHE